ENRGHSYCSNVCCMNTVKDSLLILEHFPDTEIFVFYMDLRAFGKGFEDLLRRSKEGGVRYIRGFPGEIKENPSSGDLVIRVENTTSSQVEEYPLDMIVLSVGMEPRSDLKKLTNILNLSQTADGFLMEAHPKLKPVDAPTPGIFFAGTVESPKDIKDSVTQAGAAAARSSVLLNARKIRGEAIKAQIVEVKCVACGACASVCPYGAIKVDVKAGKAAVITAAACAGCGTCAAECRFGAITMQHFSDETLKAQINAALSSEPENKIISFLCNWCSYAGGDLAGTSRLQYPPNNRFIRTMCSGRVSEDLILEAFEKGAPIVLVSGCHINDCHYINANLQTRKRVEKLREKFKKWGIRPERLQLEWISAAEGARFAEIMRNLEKMRQQVTAEEIELTRKITAEKRQKKE
ncbi:MAG TPA: hydrogenase iron-sulfur subunit, partial [Dehalococcoidales bacterium]|nr:hydrogenase iron-sulfur subunit [Dehalococcoidales bacterium]